MIIAKSNMVRRLVPFCYRRCSTLVPVEGATLIGTNSNTLKKGGKLFKGGQDKIGLQRCVFKAIKKHPVGVDAITRPEIYQTIIESPEYKLGLTKKLYSKRHLAHVMSIMKRKHKIYTAPSKEAVEDKLAGKRRKCNLGFGWRIGIPNMYMKYIKQNLVKNKKSEGPPKVIPMAWE